MNQRNSALSLLLVCQALIVAYAGVLYQSGTLGPTSISWSDVAFDAVPGASAEQSAFVGARFNVDSQAVTVRIGGHFAAHPNSVTDKFFGAIIRLSGSTDLPDSENLSTPDVLGATTLSFTSPSSVAFGDLSLILRPGWYAVVFGSGLFGSDQFAVGAAIRNGQDAGSPSCIAWPPGLGWFDAQALFPGSFENNYFVVEGNYIPEPSSLSLALLAAAAILAAAGNKSLRAR